MPGGLQFLNLLLEFATVITNQKEKTKTEEATKTKSHRFIKLNQIFAKVIHRYEYRAKKMQTLMLETFFSSSWMMQFLKKTIENVRNHRDIKLITNGTRRNYLVFEPNYHKTKLFQKMY